MEYHPDRILNHTKRVNTHLRAVWDKIQNNRELREPSEFEGAFVELLEAAQPLKNRVEQKALEEIQRGRESGKNEREVLYTNPHVVEYALHMKAPFQVVTDFIIEQLDTSSYGLLLSDPRYRLVVITEEALYGVDR